MKVLDLGIANEVIFTTRKCVFFMKIMQYQHVKKYDESLCFFDIHSG